MALQAGSPAIDNGNSTVFTFNDQRGIPRVGIRDIGAFEFGALVPQTITFAALADETYGDADFTISAKASSRLSVTFTASGNASVYQDTGGAWFVHTDGAGSATITAHQAGNDIFGVAADVAQSLTIDKANATVVVTPYTVIYDGVPHTATVTSITGVNGDIGATVGTVDVTSTNHTIAGTYASDFWSFKGSANYNNISNTSITDTIALALSALPNNLTVNRPYTTIADRRRPALDRLPSRWSRVPCRRGSPLTPMALSAERRPRPATSPSRSRRTKGTTASGTRTYTVNINAAPTIGDLTVTQWTMRTSGFTGTMTIAAGTPTFAIVGGPKGLPPGMTAVLSGNTIRFTGTPTKAGTFDGSITIRDSAGAQVTKKFTIKINPALNFFAREAGEVPTWEALYPDNQNRRRHRNADCQLHALRAAAQWPDDQSAVARDRRHHDPRYDQCQNQGHDHHDVDRLDRCANHNYVYATIPLIICNCLLQVGAIRRGIPVASLLSLRYQIDSSNRNARVASKTLV